MPVADYTDLYPCCVFCCCGTNSSADRHINFVKEKGRRTFCEACRGRALSPLPLSELFEHVDEEGYDEEWLDIWKSLHLFR